MATGFLPAVADGILDDVFNAESDVWIRLHVGDPGNGTANTTSNVTVQRQVSFPAADGGTLASSAVLEWVRAEITGSASVSHWSAWSGGSSTPGSGTCVATGPLGGTYNLSPGYGLRIPAGQFTAALNVATGSSEPEWPNLTNTGVPDGWTATTTYTSDRNASTTGTLVGGTRIIEDILFDGASLNCNIDNVLVRRCKFLGGGINTWPGVAVRTGIEIEDCTFDKGTYTSQDTWAPTVHPGNYIARRCQILDMPEGFRSGASSDGATYCEIHDSFVRVRTPDIYTDWHGDGLQGFGAPPTLVSNCYFELEVSEPGGEGTSPFFWPDQGNAPVEVDGLITNGNGGFRLGVPGSIVTGLRVVSGGHSLDDGLTCGEITWADNWNATIDGEYQPTDTTSRAC